MGTLQSLFPHADFTPRSEKPFAVSFRQKNENGSSSILI